MTAPMIDEATILESLRQIVDPELDCNIVDLGLICSIAIEGAKIKVIMTLTTPGCPMHEGIAWGIKCALLNLQGVEEVDVQIVLEPQWTPECMSDYGRERTGLF